MVLLWPSRFNTIGNIDRFYQNKFLNLTNHKTLMPPDLRTPPNSNQPSFNRYKKNINKSLIETEAESKDVLISNMS